jgi:tetratricopeptide (TPR) repeat protein
MDKALAVRGLNEPRMRFKHREYMGLRCILLFLLVLGPGLSASAQRGASMVRAVEITTEPAANVWVNGVLIGTTDESGKITIKLAGPARASVRVRAYGFKELTRPVPAAVNELNIDLIKTDDEAELAYQDAERLIASDRAKAVEAYRKALKLRPNYPEANVGLARALSERGGIEEAFRAINAALKQRPAYAEAAVVKARLHKEAGEEDRAIAEFKRAIALGKGTQPEAYTGLGLLYQERGEMKLAEDVLAAERDFAESAKNYAAAIKQLGISPDAGTVYQLLGRVYEHQRKYKEAIALYREFLRIFPDSVEASAVESFIVQLQKQLDQQ